ncbi:flippase [Haliea sp. E17]|uniref:flippase n=1 Tax=Haliea sp. E17 TaxID=3401576 RepID=UPI003AAC4ACA
MSRSPGIRLFLANRGLLVNSAFAMGLKVLSSVCLLGFNLLVVHHFQPEVAGEFFLCITLVLVASHIARFGVDNVAVRHVSVKSREQSRHELDSLYSSAFLVTLCTSALIAALLYVCAAPIAELLFSNPRMTSMIAIMGMAVPFYAICLLNSYVNQGLKRIFVHIISLNLGQVTLASLVLVIALRIVGLEASKELLAACYVSGCALMMALSTLSTTGRISLSIRAVSLGTAMSLVRESLPLYVVALTQLVIVWSSQVFLGAWVAPEEVAVYTIAQRVAMLTSFALVAVNSVVAPRYAVLYHEGRLTELERISKRSVRLMLAIATPLLLLMLVFPGLILGIFGPAYTAGTLVLSVLALGQFVNVVTGSVGYLLQMSGHYREVRNNTLFAALVAVSLNVLLTPQFGSLGAAVAAAIAMSIVNLLGVWQVNRLLGFYTLKLS